MTGGLAKGVSKLKSLEEEVHIRTKQFQRKVAALAAAMLVALLGVGLMCLSGYNAFLEVTSPALAAFYTGLCLFALCGLFVFIATHPKVISAGLRKKPELAKT
ncbi:MAG: hypothetical protein EOP10_04310 [Proteobacteria bacterium]|nr:MAG: hypothetical protein EOP10_04310 [Pseudomonadota bacterium]